MNLIFPLVYLMMLLEPPQQDKRRILILVVKILQNMANRVDFGAKETFMAPFNALISSTSPKLFSFLTTISDVKLLPKLDKKNDIKFEGSGSILKSEGGSMIGSMTKGEGSIIKGEGSIIKDGSILKAENVARGDVIMVNMEELLNDLLSIHKVFYWKYSKYFEIDFYFLCENDGLVIECKFEETCGQSIST